MNVETWRNTVFAWLVTVGFTASAYTSVRVSCDRPDAVYSIGDEVEFTLTATDDAGALARAGRFTASVDNFGAYSIVSKREYDFAVVNPVAIKARMNQPGFMRLNVDMPGVTNFIWSVAVSPEGIRPGAPCPSDFDAFWSQAIAAYDAEVKDDVTLTPLPQTSTPEFEFFEVKVPALDGRHIQGILSRPKDLSKGPFPLRLGGKGAGASSQGCKGRRGCVTLEMNVHYYDVPPGSSKRENDHFQEKENREWFARYPTKRANYPYLGIAAGKADYFYYGVILATRRAIHWAADLPFVDRADITYSSTSQGGGFGIYMAAMCPFIRKAAICVPALTDLCGFKANRKSGWPRLIEEQLDANKDAACANAPYFDAAHFASRVTCPVRFVVGFSDDTCPPSAVYAAYNSVHVPDKAIIHGVGMGHTVRSAFYSELDRWISEKDEPSMKTPETSRLFERKEDPLTGVTSFWLKSGLVDFHQQSLYFTAKSMTDDGRFLVFDACPDPFRKDRKGHEDTETRRKYVVDFLKDTVYPVGGSSIDGQIPFLDVKTDRLYYVGKDHMSICVCDLKASPSEETVLCRFPESILEGGAIRRMGTHLTLTRDRKKAFIDYSVDMGDGKHRWFLGLADFETGTMAKWAETDFCSNHAGLSPVDDALGLFAYEGCWRKPIKTSDGRMESVPRPSDEVYPRMWLAHSDGRVEMQPSKIWNFATHENWADDGSGFYWSAYHGGTAYKDLASGAQRRVCPYWTIHSCLSGNGRYVVFDQWADNDGFRGCAWRVAFYNRMTGRCLAIHSYLPAIATKDRQSSLHPDAHPQFVCNGRYIVATANDAKGHMNVAVTPVAELEKITSDPVAAPILQRLPLDWQTGDASYCEVVADCARLQSQGLVSVPPVRADVSWATYGITAHLPQGDRQLPVEAFIGGDAKPMETVLRFNVPPYTTGLTLVVNAPGPFEPFDRDVLASRPSARRLEICDQKPPQRWDADWPDGTDPQTISRRVTHQFLSTEEDNYHPAGYALADGHPQNGYGWHQCIFYAVVSLWVNALECAHLSGNTELERTLTARFKPYYGAKSDHLPKFKHVDHTIVGALPLEIAILTGDARAKKLGLKYADMQWEKPKPDDPPPPMNKTPFEERLKLWSEGYSDQTRLWIDDAYMMTVLQSQAYRLTGDARYIERAAKEMVLYLDKLQLPDGLFNHAPDAPFKWGRGNGWMAAGMPMVLKHLSMESPYYARILSGYRQMMATLLTAQAEDGMWNQIVGDAESWEETSATAMFTYAFAAGVRCGWLDAAKYGSAARKGYLALVQRLDRFANLPDVCAGTCTKDDRTHYLTRPRINGDPHAQAPLLWICAVLMETTDAARRQSGQ